MKKLGILSAIMLAVCGVGLLLTNSAFGHASLDKSSIANGSVFGLSQAPGQITLTFDEEIDHKRSTMYVIRLGHDELVDNGNLSIEENQMKIGVNVLDEGVYQVRWIVITPDDAGYREGTITFAVHFE